MEELDRLRKLKFKPKDGKLIREDPIIKELLDDDRLGEVIEAIAHLGEELPRDAANSDLRVRDVQAALREGPPGERAGARKGRLKTLKDWKDQHDKPLMMEKPILQEAGWNGHSAERTGAMLSSVVEGLAQLTQKVEGLSAEISKVGESGKGR